MFLPARLKSDPNLIAGVVDIARRFGLSSNRPDVRKFESPLGRFVEHGSRASEAAKHMAALEHGAIKDAIDSVSVERPDKPADIRKFDRLRAAYAVLSAFGVNVDG